MARILIKDLGVRTGKDGKPAHRMQFSYACDQMEIGADAPMPTTFFANGITQSEIWKNLYI